MSSLAARRGEGGALLLVGAFIAALAIGSTTGEASQYCWSPAALQDWLSGTGSASEAVLEPAAVAWLLTSDLWHLLAVSVAIVVAARAVVQRLGTLRFLLFAAIQGILFSSLGVVVRLGAAGAGERLAGASGTTWALLGSALLLEIRRERLARPALAVTGLLVVQLIRPEGGPGAIGASDLPAVAQLAAFLGGPLLLPFFLPRARGGS
ncbi:MAG: rhomboid family intramembrane serine protease [Planctomycetota bacterium]